MNKITIKGGDEIEVKELTWRQALGVARSVAGSLLKIAPGGQLTIDSDKIISVIIEQESLVDSLVQQSTGRDPAWTAKLGVSDLLQLLDAIIALNVTPDLIANATAMATKISSAFGQFTKLPAVAEATK